MNLPLLGIIGGSGLYQMEGLGDVRVIDADTPFGKPSSPIIIGTLQGKEVAFLARHGIGHFLLPGEVNYRANIYALKALGVKKVVSISAVGSLQEEYAPGHIIIPDNLFDFTKHNRPQTFFGDGIVGHVSVADPYCQRLSNLTYEAVKATGATTHFGGNLITIEGPRFSTKAESHVFRSWGMSLIGMTACPEAFLAKEAELCYTTMAHVTDYDVWHESEEPVTVEKVIQTLMKNTEYAQQAIVNLITVLDDEPCCDGIIKDAIMTAPAAMNPQTRRNLDGLIGKYLK
jgi:5'-methylthioadenosine phosphorylase